MRAVARYMPPKGDFSQGISPEKRREVSALVGTWVFLLSLLIGFGALMATVGALKSGTASYSGRALGQGNELFGESATAQMAAILFCVLLANALVVCLAANFRSGRSAGARLLASLSLLLSAFGIYLSYLEGLRISGGRWQIQYLAQELYFLLSGFHTLFLALFALFSLRAVFVPKPRWMPLAIAAIALAMAWMAIWGFFLF